MTNKITIPDKPFLRIDEFAEIMGVTTKTVHNWINADKIKYIRVNKTIRIPREALFNAQFAS
jgi:excisionase family DNA binding protein